jgi:hypothetical protein
VDQVGSSAHGPQQTEGIAGIDLATLVEHDRRCKLGKVCDEGSAADQRHARCEATTVQTVQQEQQLALRPADVRGADDM